MRIDLGAYRSMGARVFCGRDRGAAVREATSLGTLDTQEGVVEVYVPEDIFAVTSSFFLSLFGPSIRALGREKFLQKYHFTGKDIGTTVQEGILAVLDTSSPFEKE